MESQNKELGATRLLDAQNHIWKHTFSFINSMCLKLATELNIPETIHKHGKPMPLPLLVSSLQIHPSKSPNVYRIMRLLTYSGFFSLQKVSETDDSSEQGYVLTDASTLLLKDHPLSTTPFFLVMVDPNLKRPWYELTNWLQTDDYPSPFHMAYGKKIWEHAKVDPNFNHSFNEAMASDTRLVISVAIDTCKEVFMGIKSLVDVGGGTGATAKAVAEAFHDIECIVFDLPHVVNGLQGSANLNFVGGNMFEAIPPCDAILMKWILHDWTDEECVKILKKCKEGIGSRGRDGKLIIIDMVLEDDVVAKRSKSAENQLLVDVLLMVLYPGKERTEKELANLFRSAGFSDYKIHPVLGSRSIIEVYP
ncbi:trans-resveratrol di-O-methyltransferase-like [Prosopis cineraria]|uniref:trans-resveratrol di-O-methyltransferase-like n=1 Tax=Prosopis cineraria TaxID=364024 RepID=UPI0024108314|nr:trans-resveratrol di-O-methyltransferase-like [Prosopis cineraria]XP_054813605.1 trans-resveratrol di-O-methyltransferase-like [Prosopis cineraria]